MKITIESTPELVHANGLPVRVWTGETERGTPIVALVSRVAVAAGADASELAELGEMPPPVVVNDQQAIEAACVEVMKEGLRDAGVAKVVDDLARFRERSAELERDLAVARASLARAGGWLVKDFHALYQSAQALHEAIVRALAVDDDDDVRALAATQAHQAIALQLARLSPAYEACEAERRGAPDRLTAAEREALAALHRWLHSPGGDGELVEGAEQYHVQVEREGPDDCERLEEEEALAYAEVIVARPEPALPHEVIRAILDDDRAGDVESGSAFVLCAMRGLQSGWHTKHGHPHLTRLMRQLVTPGDEGAHTAWLTGFRLALRDESESPTLPDVQVAGVCRVCRCTDEDCRQCIAKTGEPCRWVEPDLCSACVEASAKPVEAFKLTDAARDYYKSDLRYRAPEHLSPRDRLIIAAVDAEEALAAQSPETWVGGER